MTLSERTGAARARVDVLVPAFNAAATIGDTLRSLQEQSLRDIRILVINDGSTDATAQIVRQVSADDPRVVMVETENQGIVAARNAALELAEADYIAWQDADDIALPNRLAVQLAYLETNADCVAVGGESWHIDAAGRRTGYRTTIAGIPPAIPGALPAREPWIGPFVMMRTAACKQLGGYRNAHFAEDTDLYWRLSEVGRLYNVPDLIAEYRLHASSVSSMSVASGRLSACNSQRAASAAIRRLRGEADLGFSAQLQADLRRASTIAEMVLLSSRDMSPGERRHFATAAAAKLLELASYRHYRLSPDDCVFIGRTLLRNLSSFRPADMVRTFGWRLIYKYGRQRRWRELATIANPANLLRRQEIA